jgi:glycosyltransferase involved in cell wall biosynthesis
MIILQANKFYYPRRGADVVTLALSKLLEAHGHTVVPFAMSHPDNLPTPYAGSFVSQVHTESVRFGWQGLRTAGRMLYSFEARRKLRTLLKTTRPEVAHLHNLYHQLSPSVISELRARQIPMVMTVHDWALLGPKQVLFDHGVPCERGLQRPWDIVAHRCVKNSKTASAWAAFVFRTHERLGLYHKGVKNYIAPSVFMKTQLVAGGFREEQISVIPHFIDSTHIHPAAVGDYVGFMGGLSEEKGVEVLLEAARRMPSIPIKITGTGPREKALQVQAEKLGLRNVTFVGPLSGVGRTRFYRNALCVVVPSVTPETFGLVVLESYAAGKPVVASHIGALPEVVRDGETGVLVPPADPAALAEAVQRLVGDQDTRESMGRAGRALVESEYAPDLHYERMITLYQKVTGNG